MRKLALVSAIQKATLISPLAGDLFAFDPLSLFEPGDKGFLYEPSKISRLYTGANGVNQVSADADPLGLVLDSSEGAVLGSEELVNGDFSDGATGWSVSGNTVVGGELVITDLFNNPVIQSGVVTAGRMYRVQLEVAAKVSTTQTARVLLGGDTVFTFTPDVGVYEFFGVAGNSNDSFRVLNSVGSPSFSLDNVSVKELPGNHATQNVSGDKPAYYSPRWMDFDGSTDHLLVVDNESGSNFADFNQTISGAFRVQVPDNFASNSSVLSCSADALICGFREVATYTSASFVFNFGFRNGNLRVGSAKNVSFATANDFGESTGVTFTAGQEVTVGFTINGNDWELFIDGASNNSGTFTQRTTSDRSTGANPASLIIGARSNDDGTETRDLFDGRIGDGILIDRVLTPEDMANLHTLWSAS